MPSSASTLTVSEGQEPIECAALQHKLRKGTASSLYPLYAAQGRPVAQLRSGTSQETSGIVPTFLWSDGLLNLK